MNSDENISKIISIKDMSLETLLNLPQCSVYALLNEVDKRIAVFTTRALFSHLTRLIENIKVSIEYEQMRIDSKNIKLVILETKYDPIAVNYYLETYTNNKYTLYKDYNITTYKFDKSIAYEKGKLYYFLYIVSNNGNRILLGKFNTHTELKQFIKKEYPDNVINKVVKYNI